MIFESMNDPVLEYFSHSRLTREKQPSTSDILRCFSDFDVRFVNVSRRRYRTGEAQVLKDIFEEKLHAQIIHSSKAFITYELPERSSPAARRN